MNKGKPYHFDSNDVLARISTFLQLSISFMRTLFHKFSYLVMRRLLIILTVLIQDAYLTICTVDFCTIVRQMCKHSVIWAT